MTLRAFVDLPNGMAVRIGSEGLLLGRHRSCDIQLADESASRRHALLRVGTDGVELVVLGRKPVEVNDRPVATTQALEHGDRIALPGLACRLRTETHAETVRGDYCLRRGGERVQIRATPFVVGGGPTARVVIAGWPDEALVFQIAQGVLSVEAAEPAQHNGAELAAATPTQVLAGDALAFRGEVFAIEHADAGDASTVVTTAAPLPSAVVLAPLPRGGRLTITFADGARSVYLPGRRFRLMAALLAPPAPHAAGEFVPDSVIVPVVWHDDDQVGGRQDINVLLTRCRQDLVAAGIAATSLIERAPGGRATRVRLAPGAQVTTAVD